MASLQVTLPVEGGALALRGLDDDGHERGAQGAGQGCRPAHGPSAGRAPVDEHDDALGDQGQLQAGLGALELALDAASHEAQGELAQGRQVGLGEEAVEGHLGALRRVDVAVPHALSQRVRAHVHELDLVGPQRGRRREGARGPGRR